MDLRIHFPGNKKVHADFGGFTVATDQPRRAGGDETAPTPFDLFLASLGTCAGIYALGFCQARGIPTTGLELSQHVDWDPDSHMVARVSIEIRTPAGFPEKYRDGIVKAANLCTVKRHLHAPPPVDVTVVAAQAAEPADELAPASR
jgi:ribosomal protein S12 methylthiotransferase accessory factor